jgi:cytochrome c oxidase assembly protein subunit 15
MSIMQVTLGVSTLLLYVPVSLAALHQSGSVALLSFAIWLATELRRIPRI